MSEAGRPAPRAVASNPGRLATRLPRGRALPDDVWRVRHRVIAGVLWVHVLAIPLVAFVRGYELVHGVAETSILAVPALVCSLPRLNRRMRTMAASIGLVSASAVLVHLSGGLIEMHFHFFVVVAVIALYQDWLPFLVTIAYVLVHHGLMGSIDPHSVYNHAAAWRNPWKWAGVHSIFIVGISAACLVTWRLNENLLDDRRLAEERLRKESDVVEALHSVGRTLAAELDVERVVQAVTDAGTHLSGAQFGAFFYNTVGEGGEAFMLYTLSGAPKEAFSSFPLPRNTAIFAPTFNGERVVRLDDVTADARYGLSGPYFGMPPGHLPVRSYLAVPVFSRSGDVLGGLFFGHADIARFNETHERIVVGIAAQASVAIDNARLYESERRARLASDEAGRQFALLAEIGTTLASSLEIDEIARDAADLIAPAVGDLCIVDLLREDGTFARVAVAADPDIVDVADIVRRHPPGPTNTGHPVLVALREGTSQVLLPFPPEVVAALSVDEEYSRMLRRFPPRSGVVEPLHGRHGTIGALSVATFEYSGRQIGPSDEPLIKELARRIAIAIENATLYARQRTVAETLQHSLLPERLPDVPGLQTAARYRAGGEGVDVGGDWYDVIPLPKGAIALAMGDVVGRGERAASLMGQLRNAARAYVLDRKSPAEIAANLNRLLAESGSESMATMLFAVIDPESGTMRSVSAGHPPPLIIGPGGAAGYLECESGVPLGATPRARYTETVTSLQPGATILLYTDGLVEDRTTTLDAGMERLRVTAAAAGDDLEALCDTVLRESLAARGADDDVALLAVRIVPLGDRLSLHLPRDPALVASVRSTIRRWLDDAGASEQEIAEIVLAAGEACANAIQHAVGPARSAFDVELSRDDGAIVVTVRDEGRWRRARPNGGGRGIDIMTQFMDDVDIRRDPTGTLVTMRRRLQGRTPQEAVRE